MGKHNMTAQCVQT